MSEIRADKLHNVSGDNDSGIDLSTNDQIILKTANTAALTISSSQVATFSKNTVGAGDMVLIHTTQVSSGVGEVIIDGHFSSAYKNYKLIASNVEVATDGANMNLHFYKSGSKATGSVHRSIQIIAGSGGTSVSGVAEQSDTEFAKVGGENIGNDDEQTNFEITFYDPLATNNFKQFYAHAVHQQSGRNADMRITTGFFNSFQQALSGFEVTPSSGNINLGTFKLYGFQ